MDTGSQLIFKRMQLHRLMVNEPEWKAPQYARVLDMSPKWVYKWQDRIKAAEGLGFEKYLSQSRAPKHCWRETPDPIKDVIEKLRIELSERFHRPAGPKLILHFLHKRTDINPQQIPRSTKTIARILRERGYVTRSPKPERELLILPPPNHEWEMDFGEIRTRDGERFEFFIVVDRGTSRVIYAEASMGYNAETALEALARLFLLHGMPKRLRFDRDPRFVTSWTADSYASAMIRFMRALHVEPVPCPPHRPDLKPVVERCIKTLKYEWLNRFKLEIFGDALDALDGFKFYHNKERPHQGQACQNRVPDEAFPKLPLLPHPPAEVDPDEWIKHDHKRTYRRRITSNGTIQIDKHVYYIDENYAKQNVLVHLDAIGQQFAVTLDGVLIKTMDIRGLRHEKMDFQSYLIMMKHEARTLEQRRRMLWQQTGELF